VRHSDESATMVWISFIISARIRPTISCVCAVNALRDHVGVCRNIAKLRYIGQFNSGTCYVIGKGLAVYGEASLPVVSKLESVDENKLDEEARNLHLGDDMRTPQQESRVNREMRLIGEPVVEIKRQLQQRQLKVAVRLMRNEEETLGPRMKRVVIDIEIEELRGALMEDRQEIEKMRRRGEEPGKIKKAMEYLNKVMANSEQKTVELKGL